MNPADARRLALALPGGGAGAHRAHADVRCNGREMASPGDPDDGHAMVRLDEAAQAILLRLPPAFARAAGAWGRQGCTVVRLAEVPDAVLSDALDAAPGHAANAKPVRPRPARRAGRDPSR